MSKIIIAVILITFASIFVLSRLDPANPNNNGSETGISYVDESFITLTISGEVNNPGNYIVQKDATLEELILSAGGLNTNADERAFNETISVIEGVAYYIAPIYDEADICQDTPLVKVNINEANVEGLLTLNGIGSVSASAIVDFRNANGEFNYLEEIMLVSGIGNSTYEKIKNYITLR